MEKPLRFAYYVSGHGYGHATRVSAFASHLLTLRRTSVEIFIVSTAPSLVFADSLALGASYRYAEIDPVISQPVAYSVDRKKSLQVLRDFLNEREEKMDEEVEWMHQMSIYCVLSDAVFLACAAANKACLPSVLITNFTFDSNWSWLASPIPQDTPWATNNNHPDSHLVAGIPDDPSAYEPLDASDLAPLVARMTMDYQCADRLYLLPGAIPFPSFSIEPSLPATCWVSPDTKRFYDNVVRTLYDYRFNASSLPLHPLIPFPATASIGSRKREIIPAPMIVRHQSEDIFTSQGRSRLLDYIGIPANLHDKNNTHILVVSFGGQKFRRPESTSVTPSIQESPELNPQPEDAPLHDSVTLPPLPLFTPQPQDPHEATSSLSRSLSLLTPHNPRVRRRPRNFTAPSRIVTPTHLYIPGAPGPVVNPASPNVSSGSPVIAQISTDSHLTPSTKSDSAPQLLPPGWIAIVCGAGDDWGRKDDLPDNFFIAPRDVYMPDLMATGDVLLGKLGYGTVSEAIDSGTAFIYVPRPAIIEELGLKLLLEADGVGVEFSREKYESGDWAGAVVEAWAKGSQPKQQRRSAGNGATQSRRREGAEMAEDLVKWVPKQSR